MACQYWNGYFEYVVTEKQTLENIQFVKNNHLSWIGLL